MHKHTDPASAAVDDFSARLKPGAKPILMNTRWHEEDVAGRALEQIERKEIKGRVISIPAIAEANDPLGREPGEYLWDEPNGYNYGAFLNRPGSGRPHVPARPVAQAELIRRMDRSVL